MHYAEAIGLKKVLDGMLKLHNRFGPMHWEPAKLLVELATSGKTIAQWEKARG